MLTNLLYPLIAIVAEISAKTVDKLNFKNNRIAPRQLMLLIFIGMSLSLLLFIIITRQPFPAISLVALGLLVLVGVVSFASNVFDVLSLKVDDLSLREPMNDFKVILAGMVGYILFPLERRPAFLAVFILGIGIMYYGTHRRKLQKIQKKGMSFFLLCIILEAFLPSIYNLTLDYISPEYIALLRVIAILSLTLLFFPPKKMFTTLSSGKLTYGFASGFIYAVGTVASLYAIDKLGVVQTMLILLLGPALHYIAGYFVLKEKVRRGEVLSSLLLAGVALTALLV